MTKTQSGVSKRLRALSKQIPSDEVSRAMLKALESRGNSFVDRSIVIVGSSLIEKALEVSIRSRFVGLSSNERGGLFDYGSDAPLSGFGSRIKVAYALGILGPKTRDDLNRIRLVRNAFAHAPDIHISFDTDEVAEVCHALSIYNTITALTGWRPDASARQKFVQCTLSLTERLKSNLISPPQNVLKLAGDHLIRSRLLP